MMAVPDPLELYQDEEFAVLTLNNPRALNALTPAMLELLPQRIAQIDASDARAIFIEGAGDRAFCAGADLGGVGKRGISAQLHRVRQAQAALGRLTVADRPSLALVHGHALGGGLELALACDFRICTPQARFSLPEVKLGLVPSFGGTQRLPRLIGQTKALELILSGRRIDAEEALAIGLVSQIVAQDQLRAAAKTFARHFTAHSLPVLALLRRAVQAAGGPLDIGLDIEAECSALAHQTEDSHEGLAAFREKRAARFQDR